MFHLLSGPDWDTPNPLIGLADGAYTLGDGNRKDDHYWDFYHQIFAQHRSDCINLLEVGVADGASLQIWREYFSNAKIVGLDIIPPSERVQVMRSRGQITYVQGDQADTTGLAAAIDVVGDALFDVIIDDAAHRGAPGKASFHYLFNNGLKPGGLYFIEDVGTAYFANWGDSAEFIHAPDIKDASSGIAVRFPSHDWGMIGFLKQLVDELNIRRDENFAYPISFITLIPYLALIGKSREPRQAGA